MNTTMGHRMKTMVERLTGVPFNNGYRWLYPYVFISFLVMLTAVSALAMNFTRGPAVAYADVTYPPDAVLCPGDTLHYEVNVHVRTGPQELRIVRTFWSVDRNATDVFDETPEYAVIVGDEGVVHRTFSQSIPLLPPGAYQLRVASAASLASPAVYTVPFSVPEGCP